MGSRAAICGRRRIPYAERTLHLASLRNAIPNPHSNGHTDCYANTASSSNAYAYIYPHTKPESYGYRDAYSHAESDFDTYPNPSKCLAL
jgi:hypothetical protein